METLEGVVKHFNDKILPSCRHFVLVPPDGRSERRKQRKELTDTVVRQVLFKLDEVVADGDETIKRARQSLVDQVQTILRDLDHERDTGAWLLRGLRIPPARQADRET